MPSKLVVILSKNPEGALPTQFSDFLRDKTTEGTFPLVRVQRRGYDGKVPTDAAVILAEEYDPLPDFEVKAKGLTSAGHRVFVLSQGLSYELDDLHRTRESRPYDEKPGPLYGLEGVVYRAGVAFFAFNKDRKVADASELLKQYIG
ncbi:hypothetical protein HYY71_00660 [Candidatus Woesearchaeota archaeon]|nr:hypothetical protein [Candidatus Woesearchaeota archaeon]